MEYECGGDNDLEQSPKKQKKKRRELEMRGWIETIEITETTKIRQDTWKFSRDRRRYTVTQTPVKKTQKKTQQLELVWKTLKE